MTNLALLAMDKELQAFAPNTSNQNWILMFVAFEHIFMAIKYVIEKVIPDIPKNVKEKMDRNEFLLQNKQS